MDLEPFYIRLADYARLMGVSRSTMKRRIKDDPDAAQPIQWSDGVTVYEYEQAKKHRDAVRERQAQLETLRSL